MKETRVAEWAPRLRLNFKVRRAMSRKVHPKRINHDLRCILPHDPFSDFFYKEQAYTKRNKKDNDLEGEIVRAKDGVADGGVDEEGGKEEFEKEAEGEHFVEKRL